MKNIRIISLMLACVLVLFVFVGCGAKTPDITVTVKIVDYDKNVVAEGEVAFSDENPTALLALEYFCYEKDIELEYDEATGAVTKIGDIEEYVDEKTNLSYYWSSKYNGTDARAAHTTVETGGTIEFFVNTIENKATEIVDPDAQK